MSKRVFKLLIEHWRNKTFISDGIRITFRIECCPIIISSLGSFQQATELSAKSNCHLIETRTTDSSIAERTTAAETSTVPSTTERSTLKLYTTQPSSTVEKTIPNVSVRKDQMCK